MIIKGFVRDISYVSQFAVPSLTAYSIADFDVNTARQAGLINLGGEGNYLAYARWISPKRTRSYPFARLYDTFHVSSPRVAIIPIIKDEGADSGNNDRINYMTFSWMSLLNIFIILVWYDDAKRKVGDKHLITAQKIDPLYVREKLLELSQYRLSALHWNTSHFERDFSDIYQRAVESYQRLSATLNVRLHNQQDHLVVLNRYLQDEKFSLDLFRTNTLDRSRAAANREVLTTHLRESLSDGAKNLLFLSNYLGGEYHLAPDEVFIDQDRTLIIQESKNTTRSRLPSSDDIKDGLFKLILYCNLNTVSVDEVETPFRTQLKLTGSFAGRLALHNVDVPTIRSFCATNLFSTSQTNRLIALQQEILANPRLRIYIAGTQ